MSSQQISNIFRTASLDVRPMPRNAPSGLPPRVSIASRSGAHSFLFDVSPADAREIAAQLNASADDVEASMQAAA